MIEAKEDEFEIRPATPDDAQALVEAHLRNREHLRSTDPLRSDAFYTVEGQRARLAEHGTARWVVTHGDKVIGRADLSGIVLGPFRTACLGYWIDGEYLGRGLALRAAEAMLAHARDDLGLHRVEASTLTDNVASQRVLAKCGFEKIGFAPMYLHINGAWRDHFLFQRILHDDPPPLS
ncbi:GNAT family N-acetyltransferase [Streptomyces sp. TRM66268-LWL]|uniref:GNAT family N-acetyltransferase n=1 Tax=Streptomyces polyasparticus TaxID=2767826 RepID=A0ABR7SS33_9ACTN|nr:GNAT family protein [Streptomyces polyasparticus]MBC9718203.1 GNAT family N-acetyltransferase [Streptomyces polyasparticus]